MLSGYNYRVPITVTNSSGGTLTNYQVHVTLNTSALISAGKMQSSGNDLAATDTDGNTQINLWFDLTTLNTTTTDVWIKIPSLTAGSYTIYLYYGNPSASMQSSISNTFIYGDDFSSNTIGNYTTAGTVVVDTANKKMDLNAGGGNATAVPTTQTDPASYIVEAKISMSTLVSTALAGLLGFKSTNTGGDGYVAQIGNFGSGNDVDIEKYQTAHLVNTGITASVSTFYPVKGTFINSNITALFNNATSTNSADATYTSGKYGMRSFGSSLTASFKNFRVRAFTATEPTTSNGAEQSFLGGAFLYHLMS